MEDNEMSFDVFMFIFFVMGLISSLCGMIWEQNRLARGFVSSDFTNEDIQLKAVHLHDAVSKAVNLNHVYNKRGRGRTDEIFMKMACKSCHLSGMNIRIYIEEKKLVMGFRPYRPQYNVADITMNLLGKIIIEAGGKRTRYQPTETEEAIADISSYVKNYRFFTNVYPGE